MTLRWSMYRKIVTTMVLFLLFLPLALGICCNKNEDYCKIIETCPSGACGNCDLSLYSQNGSLNRTGGMAASTNQTYLYNLTNNLDYGSYAYTIQCTSGTFCIGDCDVEIKQDCEELNMEAIAAIIFIPLFMSALFFFMSVFTDKKEQPVLKKFFFLLRFIGIFLAYHFGVLAVIEFYEFPALVDAMTSGVFSLGMIFYVLITLILIDFLIAVFKVLANSGHKTGDDYE